MGKRAVLGMFVLTILTASCSSPSKPTDAEVKSARVSNPAMRSIDKSRTVAHDASERTDDPSLH